MRFTLAAVALSALTAVNALKLTVVKNVVVNVTLTSVATGNASLIFTALNPVDFPITLTRAAVSAGINNTVYAHFDQPVVLNIAASGNATSKVVNGVVLDKGAIGSIGLLLAPTVDIYSANLSVTAYKIPIVIKNITQAKVPLKVNLDIFSLSKRDRLIAREAYGDMEHINIL